MSGLEPEPVDPADIIEVDGERLSLLEAAANARNVAMLTGTHGVVAAPLDRAAVTLPPPASLLPEGKAFEEREGEPAETALVRARLAAVEGSDDVVAVTRARLEVARAKLEAGDVDGARADAAAAAEGAAHAPAAHALLRALAPLRDEIDAQLEHVDHLVEHASDRRVQADWLAERGRLLEARDGDSKASAGVFAEALALVDDHAGALFGLESALDATERWADLADLLGRLAVLASDPETSAWLEVERAILLDRREGDVAGARAALERALGLAPGIGPVRDACIDHAVLHRDDARLAALLEGEAGLERDPARAARVELDAALAHLRSGAPPEVATKLLERAHGRAPTSPLVDLRVADELARLFDRQGRHADVLRVHKAALRHRTDPRDELRALRAIAVAAERAGQIEDAVLAIERARVVESEDPTLTGELDRLLSASGRHEARAVLWMREAALRDLPERKARAFLRAADASKAAGKDADVARYLQVAWIEAPGAAGAFDALAQRLAPAGKSAEVVADRVQLYEQAANATKDDAKRVFWLEKIAWLWDDVAGDAARAAPIYEEILAIEPTRRSAMTGLASAAARAGDRAKVARALLAEADVTDDDARRAELRLRAAEALEAVDGERALVLADPLAEGEASLVRDRADELVTRLHTQGGRWDLVAKTLARRAARAKSRAERVALALAEADVLANRLEAPERALAALAKARKATPGEPALAAATIASLEVVGDAARLREELVALAEEPQTGPLARASLLVRAAELDEARPDGDADATALYLRAAPAAPEEALVVDRLRRLGARAPVDDAFVPPLSRAVRALDTKSGAAAAEPLLAEGGLGVPALRTAERLARRARSAPLLANALALEAEASKGVMAARALAAVASLVAWTLPPGDDAEPWERLLASGSTDVVALDDLVRRLRGRLAANDVNALELAARAIERRVETAADDTERLLLRVELARLAVRRGTLREATKQSKEALAIDPTCTTAAVVLAEVARETGDRPAAIAAAAALADLVVDPRVRASLLRDAADLASAERDLAAAAGFLERALDANADAVDVAARLAQIQTDRGAFDDLARSLRRGLRHATSRDAIVPMASELAEVARTRLSNPMLAIEALERAREVAPDHVPTLFVLAELFIGQRAWQRSLDALGEIIERSNERDEKLTARVGRASIFGRALDDQEAAAGELREALVLDPHDARALRGLLRVPSIDKKERADLLTRLVVAEPRAPDRLGALLELAQLRRELGDASGAEGALVEAAAMSPDAKMLARVQAAAGGDDETLARVLGRAVARARESGATPGPQWLVGLGQLELGLGRVDEAIERFEEALRREPSQPDARLALARALAIRGRHETAAAALSPLVEDGGAPSSDPAFVRLLDETLSGAGRTQQAIVARELRALAGDLDEAGARSLMSRRSSYASNGETMPGSSLRSFVMPGGTGKHPIWDVAALTHGIAGKIARIGVAEQGASTRDRIKPRAVHPVRQLFDRVARTFELVEVELAVSDHLVAPVVATEDVPWVLVPSSIADWPEPHAVAALARPLVRIALGVPWFGALPAHEVLAILVAFARQVAPNFTAAPTDRVEPLVFDYEQRARRAIDRRRRRMLEEIEGTLDRAPPIAEDAFTDAILRTEARVTFLLSGDLRASLDALATTDVGLADAIRVPGPDALRSVLVRPVPRDLVSFALSGDATALRRSLGTLWA